MAKVIIQIFIHEQMLEAQQINTEKYICDNREELYPPEAITHGQ